MRDAPSVYLPPGTHLGKYELVRMLAVGGMAEIHLARATGIEGFEKLVVLKRILPQLAADEEFTRMFLDEARLAAHLHHPNVVEVFDIGVAGGSYFFTMEYVRGEDLATVIATAARRGAGISLENALSVVIGVAEGLHHAHEMRGPDGAPLTLVHRDVSPTNVLITYDGAVKVCDFGIAKAFARQSRLTEGVVKGKVAYMSPEQCRGEPLDRRSDIFAIGIVLYELTTGKRLFRGGSDYEVLQAIAERDVPPPSARVPDYPAELERIVMRALCRDRAGRFASAQELQLALEEFARHERLLLSSALLARWMQELFPERDERRAAVAAPEPARPVTPPPTRVEATPTPAGEPSIRPEPRRRRWSGALLGAALLGAAAAGGYLVSRAAGGDGGGGGGDERAPATIPAAAPEPPPQPPEREAADAAVVVPAVEQQAADAAVPAAKPKQKPKPKGKPKPTPPPDDGRPPLQ